MKPKVEWIDFDVRIPYNDGMRVKVVPIKIPCRWSIHGWLMTKEGIRIVELTQRSYVERYEREGWP